MERIPAVIKEITDEEAVIWMIDSNVQRTCILPSEKAKAYQMKMDALAKQGKRTDLTEDNASRQPVGRWQKVTAEQVGLGAGDSGRKVQRYLRLNHLLPELLTKVDDKKLPFLSGVELSYIPPEQQKEIQRYLEGHPGGITVRQAGELRKLGETSRLTLEAVEEVLKPGSGKPQEPWQAALGLFAAYFPKGSKPAYQRKIIQTLLEKWKKGEIQI